MNARGPVNEELLDLLAKLCDGTLSDDDSASLAAKIDSDADARRTYIEYVDLHASLAWDATSAADLDNLLPQQENHPSPRNEFRRNHLERVTHWFIGSRLRVALTVATSFLIAVLLVLAISPAPLFVFENEGPPKEATGQVVAGRITGSVDCVWQQTALPLGYGSSLYKGQQVELLSGTAEVTFECGAVVTLRGPATYVLDSESDSTLRTGELIAYVPQRATGFTVQTPAAIVVDQGTRFGIIVTPEKESDIADGETAPFSEEIHVFEGAVDLALRGSSAAPTRLTDAQAVRITPDGGLEELTASQRDRFPEEIEDEGDTTTADPLPQSDHPPVTDGLVLWLAADGAVRKDERGHVAVWEDMLAGDNTKAHNAAQHLSQHRPELVANSIGGKPALRFDGDDVLLLATPSNLSLLNSSYEVFIVARSASPNIQFLLGGGFEDFELHLNGDAGLRFIPAGFGTPQDASDIAATGSFSAGRAHLFSARVTASDHVGIAAIDGRDATDLVNGDARCSNNTALRLGMRQNATFPLVGEIAEVLVYSGELSEGSRRSVQTYLLQKYSISLR